MSEVETICQRVLIMREGTIVASDTPRNLAGMLAGGKRLVVEIQAPREAALEKLKSLPDVTDISSTPMGIWHRFSLITRPGSDIRERIFNMAVANGWSLREMKSEHHSLEDVFVAVTGKEQKK